MGRPRLYNSGFCPKCGVYRLIVALSVMAVGLRAQVPTICPGNWRSPRHNKKLGGLGYNAYRTMYNACVAPIMDYGSAVWGYGAHTKLDVLQNRAIRYYLGVHEYAANLAINGDMGWTPCRIRRKVEMLRLWNRLVCMEDGRLTKHVFQWEKPLASRRQNWAYEIREIFRELDRIELFINNDCVSLTEAWATLFHNHCNRWKRELELKPKLRTYTVCKQVYQVEPYVTMHMARAYRAALAKLRCGILPLEIEVGRYHNIPEDQRLCKLCDMQSVENEYHFLFDCPAYEDHRTVFYNEVMESQPAFQHLNNDARFQLIMEESIVKKTAKFIHQCYTTRQGLIYK